MNLLEYQGKALFASGGIAIPSGRVVKSAEEAVSVSREFSRGVAVKAQVHAGGRGKAGGIRCVRGRDDVAKAARDILGMTIHGCPVKELLVEERLDIERETYASLLLNNRGGCVTLMFSPAGGMDIEEIAHSTPESLIRWDIDDISSVHEYEIRNVLRKSGFQGKILMDIASSVLKLCMCFKKNDLILAEINPLVIAKNGKIIAADAKIEVDDNALFRHAEFDAMPEEIHDPYERQAKAIGISYVQMEGNIGIIASGAGLAMNTMDILESRGHKAANFLETGGGITAQLISESLVLLLSNPSVEGILANLYGGVNPMVEAAKGVIDGIVENTGNIPVVVKLLGNQQEDAWKILEAAHIPIVKTVHTEKAVDLLLEKMEGRTTG